MRERLGTAELLLIGVSLGAWACLLLAGWPMTMQPVHQASALPHPALGRSAVMVVAMMSPVLAGPYLHLWFRSLSRHRWRALTLFTLAYLLVWTVAAVLLSKAAGLLLAAGASTSTRMLLTAGLVGWQLSPTRLRCLARCHLRPRISAFGAPALIDPLRFAIDISVWCVASCWALMGVAHLWPGAELPLLALGTLVIAVERLTEPRQRSWAGPRSLTVRLSDFCWLVRSVVPLPGQVWPSQVVAARRDIDLLSP